MKRSTSHLNTDFCLQMATHVLTTEFEKGSNFVVSPLSLHLMLSLMAAGSSGRTLKQLLLFLKSPNIADLNALASQMVSLVFPDGKGKKLKGGPLLSFVNGAWVGRTLDPAFEEIAKRVYKAEVKEVDFVNKADQIREEINSWVENATKGLIKELVSSTNLNSDTVQAFANAIYFKGAWDRQFDTSKTKHKDFHLLNGQVLCCESIEKMVRPPCCDKLNVKKGLWTAEEDLKVLAYVSKHGTGNWTDVPKKAGLRRCGKSCRLRWTNYLRPNLKHESFTAQEEEMIVRLHAAIGSRWSIIAQQLPGRTDNDVKNYWNTKLRKKLSEMGIDPVTHKPFSQILADYGNIGGLPSSSRTRSIGSLNRDLKNSFMFKPEHQHPHMRMTTTTTIMSQTDYVDQDSNSHSLDLLAQLQSIKLVTEASNCTNPETIQPHFSKTETSSLSSSSSSSSPTCSTAAQVKSPQPFSWRDFLLEDAFLPADHSQEQVNVMPQAEFNSTSNQGELMINFNGAILPSNKSFEASSCSDTSFVEAMLDRDSEMLLEFPGLLDEAFN